MLSITTTQPTQAKTSQQTEPTQQTATPTTQQATQQAPARGRGGRGGRHGSMRGGGRGGRAARGGVNQLTQTPGRTGAPPRSWTNDSSLDVLSSLDLIVEWITVEGRYNLWCNSNVSKREVAKQINQFLINNSGVSCPWRGIEQQVTGLEKKFRDALAWQDQTGQGILEDADELARQAGGDPNDSENEDFVGNTINQTKAHIRKKCKYFDELKPVMLDQPLAVPLNIHEEGDQDGNLGGALNLGGNNNGPNIDRPTTPDQWSESEQGGNESAVNTLGQPLPDLTQDLPEPR
ncbi:hypothetical protein Pst134EB_030712 [Puccinia striiformis f. sp. tritici]|nr:hypothetical protein Pst134EB_030712 [Puccinia striiformis f. sp. tritici]